MNVLVACEESQRVCTAFREKGHNAFSCDILPCSGGHPEWHIHGDVLKVLSPQLLPVGNSQYKYGIEFYTNNGQDFHTIWGKWDLIIAFPPCTDLATSGARHFEKKRNDGRQRKSIEFFCKFLSCGCERVVIENPMGIMSGGNYIKTHFPDLAEKYGLPVAYTQVVQPWWFAKDENDQENYHEKTTCLWLFGVDPIEIPKYTFDAPEKFVTSTGKSFTAWYSKTSLRGKGDRRVVRSKTFPGIAKAMAEQWG